MRERASVQEEAELRVFERRCWWLMAVLVPVVVAMHVAAEVAVLIVTASAVTWWRAIG